MGSTRDIHSRDKMKVQKETYVPVKKGLSFPAFDRKKSKPIGRFKGIAG
jgi:hypothetical protein